MDEFDSEVAKIHRQKLKTFLFRNAVILLLLVSAIIALYKFGG